MVKPREPPTTTRFQSIRFQTAMPKDFLFFPTWWWWCWIANREWIAGVSSRAGTNRCMIENVANGSNPTRSWTRVHAFLSNTSLMTRTIRIDSTFRTAIWWRSKVSWQAGARWGTVDIATFCVLSARRRNAWITIFFLFYDRWWCYKNKIDYERISMKFQFFRGLRGMG